MHAELARFPIECNANLGRGGKHFQYDGTLCARARSRARAKLDASSIFSLHDRHRSRNGLFHLLPSRTLDSSSSLMESLSSVALPQLVMFAPFQTPRPLPRGRFDAYPHEALSRSTDGADRRKPISISASIQSLLSLIYASLVVLLETYMKTTFLRAPCIVGTHLSPPFPHLPLFNLQSSLLECSFASSASNNLSQNLRLHLHRVEARHTRRSLGELYLTGTVISDRCRRFLFSSTAA